MGRSSLPYWALRDFGLGQLGHEPHPDIYITRLVEIFREVRRVLRGDGVVLLNLGDTYAGSAKGRRKDGSHSAKMDDLQRTSRAYRLPSNWIPGGGHAPPAGYKRKDLMLIPHRVVIGLHADGWYVRADNIWHKATAMPSPAKDRTTTAHEYVFHLTKSPHYFWD